MTIDFKIHIDKGALCHFLIFKLAKFNADFYLLYISIHTILFFSLMVTVWCQIVFKTFLFISPCMLVCVCVCWMLSAPLLSTIADNWWSCCINCHWAFQQCCQAYGKEKPNQQHNLNNQSTEIVSMFEGNTESFLNLLFGRKITKGSSFHC